MATVPVIRFLAVLLAVLPGLAAAASETANTPAAAFFGTFEGRTLLPMGEVGNRDLRVSIRPFAGQGFSVAWETTIHERTHGVTRRAQVLDFTPTDKPGVYGTAGEPRTTAEVMAGTSLAWAIVSGEVLTIHVFTIVENGDYVIQTYGRTLTKAGLDLEFHRFRNGKTEQRIKGTLERLNDQ